MVGELLIVKLAPAQSPLLELMLWAGAEAAKPAILRMSGENRARVLAVLGGLIILGFALMLLAWLGARMTRRYMNSCSTEGVSDTAPREDEWTKKPLHSDDHDSDGDGSQPPQA